MDGETKSLWYDNNCKTLQRNSAASGEKLGHDRNSDTWFYESWSDTKTLKLWKDSNKDWGELQVSSPVPTTEKWYFLGQECEYEFYKQEPSNGYGYKTGKNTEIE